MLQGTQGQPEASRSRLRDATQHRPAPQAADPTGQPFMAQCEAEKSGSSGRRSQNLESRIALNDAVLDLPRIAEKMER